MHFLRKQEQLIKMTLRHDLCMFGNSDTHWYCRLARDRGRKSGCWSSIGKCLGQSEELARQLKSERTEYGISAASKLDEEIYLTLFCPVHCLCGCAIRRAWTSETANAYCSQLSYCFSELNYLARTPWWKTTKTGQNCKSLRWFMDKEAVSKTLLHYVCSVSTVVVRYFCIISTVPLTVSFGPDSPFQGLHFKHLSLYGLLCHLNS